MAYIVCGTLRGKKMKVAQSCLTLCDPTDYTVSGILLARILEWVAFPFSRGASQPRDRTQVSHIAGRFFTSWATKEALDGILREKGLGVPLAAGGPSGPPEWRSLLWGKLYVFPGALFMWGMCVLLPWSLSFPETSNRNPRGRGVLEST